MRTSNAICFEVVLIDKNPFPSTRSDVIYNVGCVEVPCGDGDDVACWPSQMTGQTDDRYNEVCMSDERCGKRKKLSR